MHKSAYTMSFWCIILTVLVDQIGLSIVIPIIPSLLADISHQSFADNAVIGGWLMAIYALMQFIFAPVMGALSDRFGRKPILMICLIAFTIDYFLYAIADTLSYLFLARVIAGIAGSSAAVSLASVADMSRPEEKTKNFAYVFATMSLGLIVGPTITSLFAEQNLRLGFYIASGLCFITLICIIFLFEETVKTRRKFEIQSPFGAFSSLVRRYKYLIYIFIIQFLFCIAVQAPVVLWAFFTKFRFAWTDVQIAHSFILLGVVGLFIQGFLVQYLYRLLGNQKIIYIGFSCFAVAVFLMTFAIQEWLFYFAIFIYSFAQISNSAMTSLYSSWVAENEQGLIMGVLESITSMCFVIGPIMATYLYNITLNLYLPFSDGYVFICSGLLTLVCLVFIRLVFKKTNASGMNC